jgi:hypothetical protein
MRRDEMTDLGGYIAFNLLVMFVGITLTMAFA